MKLSNDTFRFETISAASLYNLYIIMVLQLLHCTTVLFIYDLFILPDLPESHPSFTMGMDRQTCVTDSLIIQKKFAFWNVFRNDVKKITHFPSDVAILSKIFHI